MDLSARTLIVQALRLIGVKAQGGTVSGAQAAEALEILNQLVDSFNIERPMLFTSERTVKALTANDATYTIGSGGDINITRPLWIDEARIIPDTSLASAQQTEEACEILTLARWAAKVLKNFTSTYPYELYYDYGLDSNDRGIITFWPVPTGANVSAVLYTPVALSAFADLDTEYGFARAYPKALRTNLAIELAPEYGQTVSQELLRMAIESKALIELTNEAHQVPTLRCDPGIATVGGYGRYDIRSGRWR